MEKPGRRFGDGAQHGRANPWVCGVAPGDRGKGIQGARVDVYHRRGGKLKQLIKTGLKTRKSGKLTLILPLDLTTRDIVLAYRARRPGPIELAARWAPWRVVGNGLPKTAGNKRLSALLPLSTTR